MEKVLIHLNIPAIEEGYDLFVSPEMATGSVVQSLLEGIINLSGGRYHVSGNEYLMKEGIALPLNPDCTLVDYALRDGDHLILI